MKFYKKQSVYNAALERINTIFDEFPEIVVSMSGGKDSTVVFELAKQVARERGRLPLKVFWLDQECEYEATETYIKRVMYDPEVEPMWYQIPFRLQNATSQEELWLNCWGEGEQWVRERDPIAFTENTFGVDRFVGLMEAIINQTFPDTPVGVLTGVRAEESMRRMMGLTESATYKWITWGKVVDKKMNHYLFHPLYDWSYTDIWKAIHEHGWLYNTHYDDLYRYGVTAQRMRVSNYHHETAIHSLFWLQEIEPETYEKATQRISGLDTAGKMGKADYFIKDLPFMFMDWKEYRDYLLKHLVTREDMHKRMKDGFDAVERNFPDDVGESLFKLQINCIMANDYELTKLENWTKSRDSKTRKARLNAHSSKFAPISD
jgi:predicted phosphoadenosine phosphosulfate sulfurtransferase